MVSDLQHVLAEIASMLQNPVEPNTRFGIVYSSAVIKS